MKPMKWLSLSWGLILAVLLASCEKRKSEETQPAARGSGRTCAVREAAVAGLFYPKDPAALGKVIDEYLAKVSTSPLRNIRGLICPHAGYEYSGLTAACSYKTLVGQTITTAILLSPSHYSTFDGAYLSLADAYRTPLGLVKISTKMDELATTKPFTATPKFQMDRPGWWRESPRASSATNSDPPDAWEHAIEVQIPFLQRVLKDFTLVPVLYGNVDPSEVAKAIEPILDDKTVVVASTDLSHYYPSDHARELDDRCLTAVCTLDTEMMTRQEACGKGPVLTLMHLAKRKGWRARLLDYRNSGDTAGDRNRVVGYAAIAFYEPPKETSQPNFTTEERKWMLDLARKALRETAVGDRAPQADEKGLSEKFTQPRGCFVTLTRQGSLRGCIGNLQPQGPLFKAVIDNTRNAALRDYRFVPVQAAEVETIRIEISVLTEPEPLYFKSPRDLVERLQPGRDGVILRIGGRVATYLPQVWQDLPDKEDFLGSLSMKAGCPADAWKTEPTAVYIYHVESFKEPEK